MLVVPDPEKVSSSAPQDIPSLGVTIPTLVDDTPYSVKQWKAYIGAGVPVLLVDDAAPTASEESA